MIYFIFIVYVDKVVDKNYKNIFINNLDIIKTETDKSIVKRSENVRENT